MSIMSTKPVFLCRRCGSPVVVTHLSTTIEDPTGELLHEMMANLHKIAYCGHCTAQKNWYAAQGRYPDWEAGRP